ncbi:MAG: guanylate kinase [bacterium]
MTPYTTIPSHGFLLVLSGPSGAGKGTLVHRILPQFPQLELSVSATTRKPRPGETYGKDYLFMSEESFQGQIERDGFLEWAEVHGHFYGTPRQQVLDRLAAGRIVLLEIDTQGAQNVMATRPAELVSIFVTPSTGSALRERLIGRGTETPEDLAIRLGNAIKEAEAIPHFEYLVINDHLEGAVLDLSSIIRAELQRVRRFTGTLHLAATLETV